MPFSGSGKSIEIRETDLIAEASFRRVSKYQITQIVALSFAFAFSTAACLTLSYVNFVLNPDCVLFAKWTKQEKPRSTDLHHDSTVRGVSPIWIPNDENSSPVPILDVVKGWLFGEYSPDKPVLELSVSETKWGKKGHCYFTQYAFAGAAVGSFIICWFFVFFRPTREAYLMKKKTAASKLVVPAIIFCTAFVICVFVASITLQMGVSEWCDSVAEILPSCSSVRKYAITWAEKATYVDFWSVLLASQVLAWFSAIFWISNLIMLIQRLYRHVDFPDYFFKPFSANDDHRMVQSETDSD